MCNTKFKLHTHVHVIEDKKKAICMVQCTCMKIDQMQCTFMNVMCSAGVHVCLEQSKLLKYMSMYM